MGEESAVAVTAKRAAIEKTVTFMFAVSKNKILQL